MNESSCIVIPNNIYAYCYWYPESQVIANESPFTITPVTTYYCKMSSILDVKLTGFISHIGSIRFKWLFQPIIDSIVHRT